MKLAERLRNLIGDEGGAQARLAEHLGVTAAAVSQWVSDHNSSAPADNHLLEMSRYFDMGPRGFQELVELKHPDAKEATT